MNNLDIINMYIKGYSVKKIIKDFYVFKNRGTFNSYSDGVYIVVPKKYSYSYCSNYVYDVLIDYVANFNSRCLIDKDEVL